MNPDSKTIRVLYVEDEAHNRILFNAAFRNDFHVLTAASAAEGLEILAREPVHVLITDQRMPQTTGTEFLASIIDRYPDPVRILLTGYTDLTSVVEAVNQGHIFYYATKPWNIDALKTIIENAYHQYAKQHENKELATNLLKINEGLEFHLRQKLLS